METAFIPQLRLSYSRKLLHANVLKIAFDTQRQCSFTLLKKKSVESVIYKRKTFLYYVIHRLFSTSNQIKSKKKYFT